MGCWGGRLVLPLRTPGPSGWCGALPGSLMGEGGWVLEKITSALGLA